MNDNSNSSSNPLDEWTDRDDRETRALLKNFKHHCDAQKTGVIFNAIISLLDEVIEQTIDRRPETRELVRQILKDTFDKMLQIHFEDHSNDLHR